MGSRRVQLALDLVGGFKPHQGLEATIRLTQEPLDLILCTWWHPGITELW